MLGNRKQIEQAVKSSHRIRYQSMLTLDNVISLHGMHTIENI